MTAPIRNDVYVLTDWDKDPAEWTIRDAVEWSKKLVRKVDTPTASEIDYINKRFVEAVEKMAEVQKVPAGFLMYMVHELAQTELRVLDTALEEVTAGP